MVLEQPIPYGNNTLDNSPLEQTGQDFPCKLRAGAYDVTQMNYWVAGEAQSVRFRGSAVHGGGSCQFSVTTDLQPTRDTRWKVIHSMVGGCPSSAGGNLLGGADAHSADDFDVLLPKEMPNGRYTFAWTWFNRMGNREMYMNCAPISVSGGGDDITFLDALPDMFVANLPSTDCATVANFDYAFPNPGDSVMTGKQAKVVSTLDGGGCVSMTRLGAGDQTMQPVRQTAESLGHPGSTRTATLESTAMVTATHIPSVYETEESVTISSGSLQQSHSVTAAFKTDASPTNTGSARALEDTSKGAIKTTLPETCVPCSVAGSVLCIDDADFGLCDGVCAVPQPLAAGTFCSQGLILKRTTRPFSR